MMSSYMYAFQKLFQILPRFSKQFAKFVVCSNGKTPTNIRQKNEGATSLLAPPSSTKQLLCETVLTQYSFCAICI